MALCFSKHRKMSGIIFKTEMWEGGNKEVGEEHFYYLKHSYEFIFVLSAHIIFAIYNSKILTTDKPDVAVVSTPDFILSPQKASFTFPPWTTFILKGVAVSFHYFFIFPRIRAVTPEARKSKEELSSPPACPHLEAEFGAVVFCHVSCGRCSS